MPRNKLQEGEGMTRLPSFNSPVPSRTSRFSSIIREESDMLQPYPTHIDTVAIDTVISLVRGDTTAPKAVHAGYELLGYGLGQIIPDTDPAMMQSVEDCCKEAKLLDKDELCKELENLKSCCNPSGGMKAAAVGSFDWKSLIKTLLPIIISLLG